MIIYNTSELRNSIFFFRNPLEQLKSKWSSPEYNHTGYHQYSGDERLDLGSVLVEANFPRDTASQRHYPSLGSLCVDCELAVSLFLQI